MRCGKFFDQLENSIGKFIELETNVGILRSGRLTGFSHDRKKFGNSTVDVITELELNGDPTDRIDLKEIIRVEII